MYVILATLLFIIPNKKQQGEKLMDRNKCKKLPWNIVLLLGAGFAIADGVRTSGLADILSEALHFLEQVPYLAIAPAVCLISSTITEFTSNNATTTLVIPLLIQIAKSTNVHLVIPGAVGAQFAFLLPTGTPSNIVGFTTGHIEIKDMIKVGLPLKIAGTAVLTLLMPTLGTYIFGTNEPVQLCSVWSWYRGANVYSYEYTDTEGKERRGNSLLCFSHILPVIFCITSFFFYQNKSFIKKRRLQ